MSSLPPPPDTDQTDLADQPDPTPRDRYRVSMMNRQMNVYGITIAGMVIALLVALLALTGILPTPLTKEFSKSVEYAKFGDTPCPAEEAVIVKPEGTQLQVLNSSSTPGLARQVADALEANGYEIALVSNSNEPFRGNVQLDVGPGSVDHGYSLASFFEQPVRIKLEDLPPNTITIVLGEGFHGIASVEEIQAILDGHTPLKGLSGCVPVDPEQVAAALAHQAALQSEEDEAEAEPAEEG